MENLSILTVKKMGCNPKRVNNKENTAGVPVDLAMVYGVAERTKTKEDPTGFVTQLLGTFEGVNLETKKTFASSKLILPYGIQDAIEAAMRKAEGPVSFVFQLRAAKDTQAAYKFQAIPIVQPSASDPLSHLRSQAVPVPQETPEVKPNTNAATASESTSQAAPASDKTPTSAHKPEGAKSAKKH